MSYRLSYNSPPDVPSAVDRDQRRGVIQLCGYRTDFSLAAPGAPRVGVDRPGWRRYGRLRLEPLGLPPRDRRPSPLSAVHPGDPRARAADRPELAQLHAVRQHARLSAAAVPRCDGDVQRDLPRHDGADRLGDVPARPAGGRAVARSMAGGPAVRILPGARCPQVPSTSAWSPRRRCRSSCSA